MKNKMNRFWLGLLLAVLAPLLAHADIPTLGGGDSDFLPPDQAYQFSAYANPDGTITANWVIADGYYLYKNKFAFDADTPGVKLGQAQFPEGEQHTDEFFGSQTIFRKELNVKLPVSGKARSVTLHVRYQGCADAGLCYPPQTKTLEIDLPSGAGGGATSGNASAAAAPSGSGQASGAPVSEQDKLGAVIRNSALGWVLLVFFGAGLLLTFTPCVLPMLPIISSLVVGQGAGTSTGRAFGISLVYVLGMALTYTAAGVFVALLGANVQAWFQNPWVLGVFAALFVLLSLSMFGVYELQMPGAVQAKLTEVSNRQQGGTLVGAAVMGVLSALIVGPCVTAPLVAALIAIGQSGEPVRGGLALFSLSLGMGVPLLIVGTSAGKLLPRAGTWMNVVKAVFGFLLLGLALWFLDRFAPAWIVMLGCALLSLASGFYFYAIKTQSDGWRVVWKTVGAALVIWGVAAFVGLATGNRDPLQPLAGLHGGGSAAKAEGLSFQRIKSVDDLKRAVAQASANGQPVMLDFYADWCISCKEMEKYTFTDATVQRALADHNAVLLQADVTANDTVDKDLLTHFGIIGPPSIMFFDRSGAEQPGLRVVGFMKAEDFRQRIDTAFAQRSH